MMRVSHIVVALLLSCWLPTSTSQVYPPVTNSSAAYVDSLANCTSTLVQAVCNDDTCPTFDPSQTDVASQCAIATAAVTAYDAYETYYAASQCSVLQPPDWSIGLHVAAVFVVLIASSTGALIPILAKYHPGFDLDPYYIIVGKCMGIGVVLSCGLVHMLQPASESLTSPCLPWEFNTDYNAYAFLYAVLAILAMHFFEWSFEAYLMDKYLNNPEAQQSHSHREEIAMVKLGEADTAVAQIKIPAEGPSPAYDDKANERKDAAEEGMQSPTSATGNGLGISPPATPSHASTEAYSTLKSPSAAASSSTLDLRVGKKLGALSEHGQHGGHVHSVLLVAGMKRTISAYMLEVGVTVHSVFIGLANGIDGDSQLHVLLVALVFHQMFEGIALGSRIADANFPSHWHEAILTILFSLAAPLGIAIGIGVKTGLNPNGETFLMVQGTFDAICGGILIYIGLVLLLKDFPDDMQRFCRNSPKKYWLMTGNNWMKLGMFFGLYLGAGLMSFIGKYL